MLGHYKQAVSLAAPADLKGKATIEGMGKATTEGMGETGVHNCCGETFLQEFVLFAPTLHMSANHCLFKIPQEHVQTFHLKCKCIHPCAIQPKFAQCQACTKPVAGTMNKIHSMLPNYIHYSMSILLA